MKKIALSSTVILGFLIYAFFTSTQNQHSSQLSQPVSESNNNQVASAPLDTEPVEQSPASSVPESTSSPSPKAISKKGIYKDGTYTGDVEDAFFGDLQIKTTITGGKISDIQFLKFPNDRRESLSINSQAIPLLKQEAIQTQNASVDTISGATQSSQAFRRSLQSALSQANS